MKPTWRKFAPLGLYLALLAALASAGLYVVQREWNLPIQISLGLVVIGLALFAVLDPDQVRVALTGRQARYGSNALVMSMAFIGILAVVNYLVFKNPQRWDLTENRQFTLASETLEVLENLPQAVQAIAFFTPAKSTEMAEGLLDQYQFHSDGRLSYEFVNPDEDPLRARQVGIEFDGTVALQMGEATELVTLVNERELTSALIRLISPSQRAVYFLTGHGEFDPQGSGERSYSQVKAILERKNYTVATLNLLATNQVPEDAEAVVVAGPQKPLTSQEVDLLKGYLEGGGSLVVMEEPLPLTEFGEDADPLAEYLAGSWGIRLGEDLVVDLSSNQPFMAVANQYGQHLITEKMQGMVTLYPTARSVILEGESAVSPVQLVLTAENSWAETDLQALQQAAGQGQAPELRPDEGVDQLGPISLAVAAEDLAKEARLAVFGDAEFASDGWFDQYGNRDMLVNTVDWATEQENLINLTPRDETPRLLVPPGRYTMNLILLGSVFLLPGLVLAAGVGVWLQRRRRG